MYKTPIKRRQKTEYLRLTSLSWEVINQWTPGMRPDRPKEVNTAALKGMKLGSENLSDKERKVVRTPMTETRMR